MPHFSDVGSRVQEQTAVALSTALPGGRLKRLVGELTGRGADYIRECCLAGRRNAPIDVLQEALDQTGHPALFRLFETERYHMVPKVEVETDDETLLRQAVKLGGKAGRVQEIIAQILDPDSPGGAEITRDEADAAIEALDALIRKAAQGKEQLLAIWNRNY